ncbi:teneurin-a isoform X4 [Spodoptera litura]|uniref:Tenascin-like protein n=1 Tax=Spodoptera litura TaxID=69820 RepID=A0A9J7EJ65_SPOLT|nr:teneurin-a isoform X4 [Spodoptera litura]
MTMKSLKYSEREEMMEGFSPVPPPLPRRQPVRNIYAEPFVDPRYTSSGVTNEWLALQTLNSESLGGAPMSSGMGGGTLGSGHCQLANQPLVMPVFPLRASQPSPVPVYSPSRFHIDKRCQHRCTWKCLAIAMICLCVILAAMLAYFIALSSIKSNIDNSNCILVQDVKAVTHAQGIRDALSTSSPSDESISTSSLGGWSTTAEAALESAVIPQQAQQAAPPPWSPALEVREFDELHSATIPAYQFWSSEFRNKQPAYVSLNFTVPWGANFAVYGRRNVAPSVTQYDFVEFIRGGRVDHRLRRRRSPFRDNPFQSSLNDWDALISTINPLHKWNHTLSKRSTDMRVNVSILQYLDTGRWFISVYNDELQPHNVEMIVSEAEGVTNSCPDDCSGHGSCYLGKCECMDGYEGHDCSKSVCPVLCSGHGAYAGGVCHCLEGWKGPECDVPAHDCEPADCSGRGQCIAGHCHCKAGWKGQKCDEEDCLDPTCGGHGSCVRGRCVCRAGWRGASCSERDARVQRCLPACSQRGVYDLDAGRCVCDPLYTGDDCSQVVCSLDCGPHGVCAEGVCRCDDGWTGSMCDQRPCDTRCHDHGQCKNGTCVCTQGWNGRHCTLPGCPNGCTRHGQCLLEDGVYRCSCADGWAGTDCSIALELSCNDNEDNDEDGMTDCSDSECCSRPECAEHIMCLASNDPVEVLLRKQPPSVTASFYQRVKFLIEENSVQSYAHMDEYSESEFWNSFTPCRVSVMRGQVVSPQGLGIIGIRVSVDREARFGFTLTRQGGWFDVLVNGGGAVTLQFQRSPFKPLRKTVFVPWNQIVVLPPVQMELSDDNVKVPTPRAPPRIGWSPTPQWWEAETPPCAAHDHERLRPEVVAVPPLAAPAASSATTTTVIYPEAQIVSESIGIPGSLVKLTYRSSQSAGYLSCVHVQLTRRVVPASLIRVHVRVEIEGSLHTHTYEADPDLTHIFAWNKRNVYKQKVYGQAQAKISIGYEYTSCSSIVWETQTATLAGFDVDISDIGGWGLDIHHHYNFHEGILQKGDGALLHLKQYPRTVQVVMGTGLQRSLECPDHCNGKAADARLLTPTALTSGPDGSLYVGDFNLVRRITPEGVVTTVLQLQTTQVAYQYYICISPADGYLYISDSERHQVRRVIALEKVRDPATNSEPVVGNGDRCVPGDDSNCGDEGPAIKAKLAHPKGLAIAADRTMYIADGTNIRAVDPNGIIHTLVGHHGHHNHWSPVPCRGAIPPYEAQLQWPTGVALSPLDGSLYFIDDRIILKLTVDMKIKVVAGQPSHCRLGNDGKPVAKPANRTNTDIREDSSLGTILAIAFAPSGILYVAEADSKKTNAIKSIDPSGKIMHFAGKVQENLKELSCECNSSAAATAVPTNSRDDAGCPCRLSVAAGDEPPTSTETLLSSNAKFQTISALAVTPDGVLNVVDQGSLHILALKHYLPTHDENGEFRIPYPPTSEIYVFNRYGQHITTKDLTSGKTRYSFLYSKNTSFGKLSTVTDASGNKIQLLRDYSNIVSSIENTQDHKLELKISGIGYLTRISEKGSTEMEFDYDASSGLLNSRSGAGDTVIYNYDELGRVTKIIMPSGEQVHITSGLAKNYGLAVTVSNPSSTIPVGVAKKCEYVLHGQSFKQITINNGKQITEGKIYTNNTLLLETPWAGKFESIAAAKHPLLEAALPIEAEMLHMWSHQTTTFGDALVNNMYSLYTLVGDVRNPQQTLNREIWVNDSRVLIIEFDQFKSRETFFNADRNPLFTISYDVAGLPLSFNPHGAGAPLNISYDRFNRINGWKWGDSEESYSYDPHGMLSEITSPQDGTKFIYYNEGNLVSKISLASQRSFKYKYDNDGGLTHVILPSGSNHSFSVQPSIGFLRVTYTPPGSSKKYLQHYAHTGELLQTVFPGDGARVVYRYFTTNKVSEVIHGDGQTQIHYAEASGLPSEILHVDRDVDYRWESTYVGGLLTEERLDYGAKTGLSNAKIIYEYDNNYRITSVQGRIGGQTLIPHHIVYNSKTGAPEILGQFTVSKQKWNETSVYDGIAMFSRLLNDQFLEKEVTVNIHRMEVFRMEFSYDRHGRISQTRTHTRNVGVNTYTNVKNYTWDCDGQLTGVEAQEPWGFRYDDNGNMLSLTYRGNTIPMEYNDMDRIVKFGEGQYRYDSRGLVSQNAREERFQYNSKGLLIRATKRGRFDVRYFYDHLDRLSTRKDNFGNVTQFFYTNKDRPHEVSHIYSPRENRFMTLVYDDRGHLIYTQVARHKYYIATDQCGTPVMIFNQYGEGIREIMRSPYGHIVYDSNPYLYLPVDFCGGLLDQVTSLVHMANGKVYDPLIGQWMSPLWENLIERIHNPTQLHLYRFNGNDPINVRPQNKKPTDHLSWLKLLGYDTKSLAPQLYPDELPGGSVLPSIPRGRPVWGTAPADTSPGLPSAMSLLPTVTIESGFLSHMSNKRIADFRSLSIPAMSALKTDALNLAPKRIGSDSEPPFGRGILVSRNSRGRAVVTTVPSANAIYRDVYTSVFNRSHLLPFSFVVHGDQQDVFYFVKEDTWRAADDKQQLKRMQGKLNVTFHEVAEGGRSYADVKIHGKTSIVNLRYGTSAERERQRLLHHARAAAVRKAWHREREALRSGLGGSLDWSAAELDEIQKAGSAAGYEGEYVHDVARYPELAEDPYNIRFVKKRSDRAERRRRKRSDCRGAWWLAWDELC